MTMVLDSTNRHFGGNWDSTYHMHNMHAQPAFTDPWSHHAADSSTSYPSLPKTEVPRPTGIAVPSYSQLPVSAPVSQGSGTYSNSAYAASELSMSQEMPRSAYEHQYTAAPAPQSYAATASQYPSLNYAQSLAQQQQQQQQRKASDPNDARAATASFGELDASRGMLALSHQNLQDLTPRNIYEVRQQRGPTDSYGFPSASSASSMSGASARQEYPYYDSSVASLDSATDYSSAASDAGYDSMAASRTLPRPSQLLGANLGPPAPQSMMGQFSSKMSSNTKKKHKCKVCDKRFTRPSSLQTHMYSHTGEKPFACNVDGCGRHFSVVSNQRRHKKVHRRESVSSQSDVVE